MNNNQVPPNVFFNLNQLPANVPPNVPPNIPPNIQPNVFNFDLNEEEGQQLLHDVFNGVDIPPPPPPPANPNNPDEDAIYDEAYIRVFPQNKIQHIIGVAGLEPNAVYYKVIDNNTRFDRTQLQYLGDPYRDRTIYKFTDNYGHNNIPLTNQSRFIPAYLMLDNSYPKPDRYKYRFFSIYGIDPEETSNDEDSSDESESGSEMSVGGKKQKKFHFTSTQKHQHGGKKTVRHVSIKNGKGHKKVSHYRGNKLVRTIKKSLKKTDMEMIRLGKFIPGLFRDCQVSRKKSTTRHRRNK
jgi:hypothetical protein